MKILKKSCIDCGSPAIGTSVNRTRRTEVITYECGAVLTTSVTDNGNGKVMHSGCTRELQVAAV